MSTNAIELVLYDISCDATAAERFRSGPEAFLGGYRLDAEETALIRAADVLALRNRNVNDMLLTTFFRALYGRAGKTEYMRRMNGG